MKYLSVLSTCSVGLAFFAKYRRYWWEKFASSNVWWHYEVLNWLCLCTNYSAISDNLATVWAKSTVCLVKTVRKWGRHGVRKIYARQAWHHSGWTWHQNNWAWHCAMFRWPSWNIATLLTLKRLVLVAVLALVMKGLCHWSRTSTGWGVHITRDHTLVMKFTGCVFNLKNTELNKVLGSFGHTYKLWCLTRLLVQC